MSYDGCCGDPTVALLYFLLVCGIEVAAFLLAYCGLFCCINFDIVGIDDRWYLLSRLDRLSGNGRLILGGVLLICGVSVAIIGCHLMREFTRRETLSPATNCVHDVPEGNLWLCEQRRIG